MTAAERMARWRTSVDLAGDRPVGKEGSYFLTGHHEHRPPTAEERAEARERALWRILDGEARERDGLVELVAALRRELALYRPEPDAAEPAPRVPGYWLVSVAAHTGLCYAKSVVEQLSDPDVAPFEMPATKTLCGKATQGPGSFPGYGWPPASMTCAKCRAALPEQGGQMSLLEDAS